MAYKDLNFQPIVAPYVGGFGDAFNKGSEKLQEVYRENQAADFQREVLFSQMKTLEGDDLGRKKVQEEMDKIISGAAKDVQDGKIAYELAGSYVKDATKKMLTDKYLQAETLSYQNYDEAQKLAMQMKAQGLNPLEFRSAENWRTTGEDGSINVYQSGLEKELDWMGRATSMYDQITPNSVKNAITTLTDTDIDNVLAGKKSFKAGYMGISSDRIKKYTDEVYTLFRESPEGDQRFRKLTELDRLAPEEAEKQMKRELLQTGKERVFSQTETGSTNDLIQLRSYRKQQSEGIGGVGFNPTTKRAALVPSSSVDYTKNVAGAYAKGDPKQAQLYNTSLNHTLDAFIEANPRYAGIRTQEKDILNKLKDINPNLATLAQGMVKDVGLGNTILGGPFDKNILVNPTISGFLNSIWSVGTGGVGYQLEDELIKAGVDPKEAKTIMQQAQPLLKEYEKINSIGSDDLYDMYEGFNTWSKQNKEIAVNTPLILPDASIPSEIRTKVDQFMADYTLKDFNIFQLPEGVKAEDLKETGFKLNSVSKLPVGGVGNFIEVTIPLKKEKDDGTKEAIVYLTSKDDRGEKLFQNLEQLKFTKDGAITPVFSNDVYRMDRMGKSNMRENVPLSQWNYGDFSPLKGTNLDIRFQKDKAGGYSLVDPNNEQLTLKQAFYGLGTQANGVSPDDYLYSYAFNKGHITPQVNAILSNPGAYKPEQVAQAQEYANGVVNALGNSTKVENYYEFLGILPY